LHAIVRTAASRRRSVGNFYEKPMFSCSNLMRREWCSARAARKKAAIPPQKSGPDGEILDLIRR
jgi:hypothetical protein